MGFLDRVLVMSDGLNFEQGSTEAALRRPCHRALGRGLT
jgi:ABC-type antimicrobial peptide transport system ATPase subunit